jgi:hypothetical protein
MAIVLLEIFTDRPLERQNFMSNWRCTPVTILLFYCLGPAAEASPRPSLNDYLDSMIIVGGEVLAVRNRSEVSMEADVRIDYVYWGPKRFLGAKFVDYYQTSHSTGSFADTPLKKGQKGIWSLLPSGAALSVNHFDRLPGVERARDGEEREHFPEAKGIAEAVEKLGALSPEKQIVWARDAAIGRNPDLAEFAIRALADSQAAENLEFFDTLVDNERLTLRAQVALDSVLSRSVGAGWQTSDRRLKMIGRWVRGKFDESGHTAAFSWLYIECSHRGLAVLEYFPLLEAIADNTDFPLSQRKAALSDAARIAFKFKYVSLITPKEREAAVMWLVHQIRDQKNAELRLDAAKRLKSVAKNDPRAARLVVEAIGTIKDPAAKAILERD